MSESVTIQEITQKRKDGELVGFRCENGHTWVSPSKRCAKCASKELKTVELPKEGEVLTFTIQNVAAEEFMNETPFAWAVIELTDGTRVTGWVPYV
ncbi:MAG: OB-fold domain-containing protein, partial [Candidatus Thermoplasmatota archaeon]|nr:OB-fold domain-containing protein [Candidatus Thermoplasmatota archaeon]